MHWEQMYRTLKKVQSTMMFRNLFGFIKWFDIAYKFINIHHPEAEWFFLDKDTLKQNQICYLYATPKKKMQNYTLP